MRPVPGEALVRLASEQHGIRLGEGAYPPDAGGRGFVSGMFPASSASIKSAARSILWVAGSLHRPIERSE